MRDERGYTLIEVVISVWILGLVSVTLCGALITMIHSSDITNRKALVEQELRRWADALRAAPYQPCASSTTAYVTNFGATGSLYSDPTPYYTTTNDVNNANAPLAINGTSDWALVGNFFGAYSSVTYYHLPQANVAAPTFDPATKTWPYDPSNGSCSDPGTQQIAIRVSTPLGSGFFVTDTATITKRDGGDS